MSNNVKNRIVFDCSAARVKEILEAEQYDCDESESPNDRVDTLGSLDFLKLIPVPRRLAETRIPCRENIAISIYLTAEAKKMSEEDLKFLLLRLKAEGFGTKSDLTEEEIKRYTWMFSYEELYEAGKRCVENFNATGYVSASDFMLDQWETSYNCFEWTAGEQECSFLTRNTAPHPVIDALAKKYPDVTFTYTWASDDLGELCGRREFENGECVYDYEPETRKEAVELAAEVWGGTPETYELVLNARGSDYVYVGQEFAAIELFGKPALFTSKRLSSEDIPKGLYLSHVRGDDETSGGFATLEPYVLVNHYGTIITREPVDFGKSKFIEFTEDTEPNFTGETKTFADLLSA